MKTLIIYNVDGYPLRYAIVDGDYSDLNGVHLNSFNEDPEKEKKAEELLWCEKCFFKIDFSEDISLVESKNWDKVALITFIYN